jgi:DNA processing protein
MQEQKTETKIAETKKQSDENSLENIALLNALSFFRPLTISIKLHELIKYAGGIAKAWAIPDETLEQYGWTTELRQKFNEHRARFNVENELQKLYEQNISFVSFYSPQYPEILRTIFDPPLGLYVRGSLPQNSLNIAFVGSRKATPYGKTATNMLVRPLAAKGVTIVSGLAYGIDAEAHRATLSVHGTTVAVLGNGCDEQTMYPRAHRELARQIIAEGGAVISEYPPKTSGLSYFFPQRNRIVSGLSRALVIIEASEKSGALITARLALDQNREVFALPGPITSETSHGTNSLLREGANPALSAEQILETLELFNLFGERKIQQTLPPNGSANAPTTDNEKILEILSSFPITIDKIVEESKLPSNVVSSAITMLEIDGLVKDTGGRNYIKV